MAASSKASDIKRVRIQKALDLLPPPAIVSLDSGILILCRTPWRKPRIRQIYDRIGFVGLGPIPAHFSQIHMSLVKSAHDIGDYLSPANVYCEDLADEASHILSAFFHNDSRDEVHYVFAEVMLAEISLAVREFDYLAYITYDGRVVEASEDHGAVVVSGLSWKEDKNEDEDEPEDSCFDSLHSRLAKQVLGVFREIWRPDADPRMLIAKYRELVSDGGMLEIGWLDRGMVWEEKFDQVFHRSRDILPDDLPTMKHLQTPNKTQE